MNSWQFHSHPNSEPFAIHQLSTRGRTCVKHKTILCEPHRLLPAPKNLPYPLKTAHVSNYQSIRAKFRVTSLRFVSPQIQLTGRGKTWTNFHGTVTGVGEYRRTVLLFR